MREYVLSAHAQSHILIKILIRKTYLAATAERLSYLTVLV